jgi:Domain of unknown function (DUF4136)
VSLGLFFFVPRGGGKIPTDFDPNLDFSQLKTFAFIGGVEQLVRLQLNPNQLNDRIHRSVVRELTAKGLREVQPEENPDLVVRYWANSQKDADAASGANWGVYVPDLAITGASSTTLWSLTPPIKACSRLNSSPPKSVAVVWRMFASVKLIHTDPGKMKTAASFARG